MSNHLLSSAIRLGRPLQEQTTPEQPVSDNAAESLATDDPYYQTRLAVVAQINRDRAANGVGPVEFDQLSSQVGDQHCQEMAAHTHVGIGLGVVAGELAMTQLFVNRYVRFEAPFPLELPNRSIEVRGEILKEDFGPFYCILFYEGALQPRTVEQLNQTYSYTDPSGQPCSKVPSWQMSFDRGRGRFRLAIPVGNCGPGYYRMMLWVRRPVESIPYQLPMGLTQIDTKNGIGCAGWVFRKE